MATKRKLRPAVQLAKHRRGYPNESRAYGRARANLLAEEIELRRQIERVAAQRRALPPGGEVPADYLFEEKTGRCISRRCSASTRR